ncbi:MAG: efflux transporter periplasmic adaptor subunit, partial [Alphaproteobacteria bacterium]
VAESDAARARAVRTGIRGTEAVEILTGLEADARVISPFPEGLADGARIKVTGPAAAARAE